MNSLRMWYIEIGRSDSNMMYMKILLLLILIADEYGKCSVGIYFIMFFFHI